MSITRCTTRSVEPDDWLTWERMRYSLWPGEDEEHGEVIRAFFNGSKSDPEHVFFAEVRGEVIGFAELSIKTDLPELPGKRVGYIEGMYVSESVRHSGIARELLNASRRWAIEQGCDAFASDREDRVIVDKCYSDLFRIRR